MDLYCLFSEVTTVGSLNKEALSVEHHRVCKGTDTHIGHHKSAAERYDEYKVRYTNCTMVNGNLEIVFLDDPPYDQYDLSFLNSITYVPGHVLYQNLVFVFSLTEKSYKGTQRKLIFNKSFC